jgi:hypothetical protein
MSTTLAKICNQEALGRKSVWISARLRSTSVSEVTDIFHYVPTSNWRLMLRKHWIEKGICKGVHSETPLDRHPTLGTYREVQFGSFPEGGTTRVRGTLVIYLYYGYLMGIAQRIPL